jgi:UDP-N-acetylglucosamine--N-acetylmuramyl-(pentapeptide) pyrophosphoryl-undecaprenol N-acetylglucosamine transferase
MVMAGGTGGHVFPALAVADYLRECGETIVWMGTRNGIESRLVPQAGYRIEWLEVSGLRGKGKLTLLAAPFRLLLACWQAARILLRNRPRAVLGMGGFVAGPGGLMAWLLRVPLIIHEQNAITGLTNRLLRPLARVAYFAFPQALKAGGHDRLVGNPVRAEIAAIAAPEERFAQRQGERLRLLVIGGSLGARALNSVVPEALVKIDAKDRPEVRHQCGERHIDQCRQSYAEKGVDAEVVAFFDDMSTIYAWADLVICRAGAMTVSELAAAGMASILVPFPYAVDDHQFHNAQFLARANAARVIRENDLSAQRLSVMLEQYSTDRTTLLAMSQQARSVAQTDAARQVGDGILKEAL